MLIQIGTNSNPADADRIFDRFFAAVTKQPIDCGLSVIQPKPLIVSPLIFRELECPEKCGACCRRYALNYIPTDFPRTKESTTKMYVYINRKQYMMYTDLQEDHTSFWCRNLDTSNGRCKVYDLRPFECDLPPIQVNQYKSHNLLTARGLGRAWNLTKVDNTKGALSKIHPANSTSVNEARRKLKKLKEWADYFELDTWLQVILDWAQNDPIPQRELRLGF